MMSLSIMGRPDFIDSIAVFSQAIGLYVCMPIFLKECGIVNYVHEGFHECVLLFNYCLQTMLKGFAKKFGT